MPGDTMNRHQQDEDTAIGFQGHITNQSEEMPEQVPHDSDRRRLGSDRTPNRPGKRDERKGKKRSTNKK